MTYDSCIGCGYCCLKAWCAAAQAVHGVVAILRNNMVCPSLAWNGSRHICLLMTGEKGDEWKKALGAGIGCSSNMNSWRREPLQKRF